MQIWTKFSKIQSKVGFQFFVSFLTHKPNEHPQASLLGRIHSASNTINARGFSALTETLRFGIERIRDF
jgi:hypothetical protein